MNAQALSKAEAAFKKEQKAIEARTAWREYESNRAAADAAPPAIRKKRSQRA